MATTSLHPTAVGAIVPTTMMASDESIDSSTTGTVTGTGTGTGTTPSFSSTSIRNSILAGYAAGITGTLVGHPLDSAKVWLQTQQQQQQTNHRNTATITPSSGSGATTASATATSRIRAAAAGTGTITITNAARSMSTLAANLNLTGVTATSGSSSTAPSSSLVHVSRHASTLRALYKGIGGPLVTVGMVQSINFAVYDSCRRTLYNLDHPQQQHDAPGSSNYLHNDSLYNVAASSMVAGTVLACFTSPMLIVKTQQQVHGHSFRRAAQEMIRPDKAAPLQFRNMFVGFGVHSFSEIIGRAVYFVTYEHLKRTLFQYRQQQQDDLDPGLDLPTAAAAVNANVHVNLTDRMASAALAGILCWAAIFPIDAIRCRLYAERPTTNTRFTAVQMARHMHQQAGWRAFYRGFGVTVLRAGPVAAAVLPVYDLTLETLSGMD